VRGALLKYMLSPPHARDATFGDVPPRRLQAFSQPSTLLTKFLNSSGFSSSERAGKWRGRDRLENLTAGAEPIDPRQPGHFQHLYGRAVKHALRHRPIDGEFPVFALG
jgi:hypothetical protein